MKSDRPWKIVHAEASMGWGGQERRILREIRGFRERGCDVRLVADQGSQVHRRAVDEEFDVFHFSPQRLRYPVEFLRVRHWLKEFAPDVVNTHSSRDGWINVGLAARAAKVPFLIPTKHFDVPIGMPWLSRFAY